jgi:hypothetical protein
VDPRNEAVLTYLEAERVAAPETNTAWIIDGYSLATHPDLCGGVEELDSSRTSSGYGRVTASRAGTQSSGYDLL